MTELLNWLESAEVTLTTLEAEPLPDDLPTLEDLIKEHQVLINFASINKKLKCSAPLDIKLISSVFLIFIKLRLCLNLCFGN